MTILRKILLPLSLLYGGLVYVRNRAFEKGILKSRVFLVPTIVIGNLNTGGTGKSPQIEYLIRLLANKYRIAVLSRGYKRKSKGFQLADKSSDAEQIGDEPLQFYTKFKNISVSVDTDRVNGICQLMLLNPAPEIILLDDAFQHRKVNGGLNILLTSFTDLYIDDFMLPSGNLREQKRGAKRANIIIVTKCPDGLSKSERLNIIKKLSVRKYQEVYFSKIVYQDKVIGMNGEINVSILSEYKVLLVTGIANDTPLLKFLGNKNINFKHKKYRDHHHYTELDKANIIRSFEGIHANKKIILTTEKDYVRAFSKDSQPYYYIAIQTKFINAASKFNQQVLQYLHD